MIGRASSLSASPDMRPPTAIIVSTTRSGSCSIVASQEDSHRRLFMIGHNPAFTDLVNHLTGGHSLDNLPTAGYVELALAIDRWRDLREACAVMSHCLFPKQLVDG